MKAYTENIFRTEIYSSYLNFDLNKLTKYCFELENYNKSRKKSNLGGWQSGDLFDEDDDVIFNLRKLITKHLNNYSVNLSFKKFKLTNLWININGYKDTNMKHMHPGSVLSGVFYVKLPNIDSCGNLVFFNPAADLMEYSFNPHRDVLKYDNRHSSTSFVKPKENLLIIFPSWVNHLVEPNMSKEKRISISFNSMFDYE